MSATNDAIGTSARWSVAFRRRPTPAFDFAAPPRRKHSGHPEADKVVYSRTLSKSGCPECAKVNGPAKSKAAKQWKRREADRRAEAQIETLLPFVDLAAVTEPF